MWSTTWPKHTTNMQSSWKEKQSYQFDFVCDEGLAFSTSVGMKMDGREMSARSAQDIRASQARDNQAPAALILRPPTMAEPRGAAL